jgi:iron complex outermembrane recepter protein
VIDEFVTADLAYTLDIEPLDATLSMTVQNITDEDPPFARLDLNYDPFTGNPLGRVFKVGFRKKF